jgi:hypothetical protein
VLLISGPGAHLLPNGTRRGLVSKESAYSDLGGEVLQDFTLDSGANTGASDAKPIGAQKDLVSPMNDAVATTADGGMKAKRKVSYFDETATNTANDDAAITEAENGALSTCSSATNLSAFGTMGGNTRTGLTDSLRYDLQSEDGDSAMAHRGASTVQALSAAQHRKVSARVAVGEGCERQRFCGIACWSINCVACLLKILRRLLRVLSRVM